MKRLSIFKWTAVLFFLTSSSFSQYENIPLDNSGIVNPQEVSIAINPTNPNNLVAGSNKNYYYYSFDAGQTWTSATQTSQYGMCGDPCIIFDAEGTVYYGHISEPSTYWPDRIVVHKSTDGGINWDHEFGIGFVTDKVQDKEWLAVDNTNSSYKGNIYASWTQFDKYDSSNPADKTIIRFSRSIDKGETWIAPIKISETDGNCLDGDDALEGAVPTVGPNGEVYIAWAAHEKIYFDKSTDGGVTFGEDKIVSTQPGGWSFDIPGIFRCNGMPITCCDISNSPHRGTIYINWSDQRNGTSNTDIFLIKSTDGGETWSDPIRVNDDTSDRHQFFTWMTVDPVTGYLYFIFYDRRNTSGNETDVYVARSKDGGVTFENFKISESSFNPNSATFFGDYTNIAALNGKIYPIWMRLDGNDLSIWMTFIEEQVAINAMDDKITNTNVTFIHSYTNPSSLQTVISYKLSYATVVDVSIFNTNGQLIKSLSNGLKNAGSHTITWNANEIGAGIYFYKITAGEHSCFVKCILAN